MSNGEKQELYYTTLNAGKSIYTKTYPVHDSNGAVIEYEISIDNTEKAN